jgi:ribosomal protein L7/L12
MGLGAPGSGAGESKGLPAGLRAVLAEAESLEVVSLDPNVHRGFGYGEGREAPEPLARWLVALAEADGVHGRVEVGDAATRRALLEGLEAGLAQPGPPAGCYDPRHALVARKGGVTVAVHLCFACNFALLLDPSTKEAQLTSLGDPKGLQARLNALLRAADVPLAPPIGNEPELKPLAPEVPLGAWEAPDALTLYGIDENVYRDVARGDAPPSGTYLEQALAKLDAGEGVKARAALTRVSARAALLTALRRGLAMPGEPAECYNPRHAVVVTKGPERAVAFLCFECSYAVVAHPRTAAPNGLAAFGDPGRLQARLDMILAHAGAAARFDVHLTSVGANKIAVIKVVRELTGLGLKDANDLVQRAPTVVLRGLDQARAQAALRSLTTAGASAETKPHAK